jgi:hypothetical protein
VTDDLARWVEAVVDDTEDDYVGMTRLAGLLDTGERPRDLNARARRCAAVLDALLVDDRVVVVDGFDMLTPVQPGIGDRYLAAVEEKGEVFDGEFAWVMDRATWDRDVARRASGTTTDT